MYTKCHVSMSNTSAWNHLNTNLTAFWKSNQCNIMIHIHNFIFHDIFLVNDDLIVMFTKCRDSMSNQLNANGN